MEANLCKCINCNEVLIDFNPHFNAVLYTLTGFEKELKYVPDSYGGYYVCPFCFSDEYLVDL